MERQTTDDPGILLTARRGFETKAASTRSCASCTLATSLRITFRVTFRRMATLTIRTDPDDVAASRALAAELEAIRAR